MELGDRLRPGVKRDLDAEEGSCKAEVETQVALGARNVEATFSKTEKLP